MVMLVYRRVISIGKSMIIPLSRHSLEYHGAMGYKQNSDPTVAASFVTEAITKLWLIISQPHNNSNKLNISKNG